MSRTFTSLVVALLLIGCGAQAPQPRAESWPEADELFRHDPLWLGSDGAYSTDLGNGRVLWLFGDSGIARDATRNTSNGYFIRNSLAIQTGYDPSKAFINFYWGTTDDQPSSFFPEEGTNWFWPGAPIRVGSGLIVFLQRLFQESPGTSGFKGVGTKALYISNPDDDPTAWLMEDAKLPDFGGLILGNASMLRDGHLYVYGNPDVSTHPWVVARFSEASAAAGDLSHGEFFTGGAWRNFADVKGTPDSIFSLGPPESSVHWEPRVGKYLLTQSEGYGATTLALRSADHPEGPWTDPRTFFRPPESFLGGTFVYAGKGHPELTGADFVVTYFPSTRPGAPPLPFPNDFYPRFVKVTF